jgi:ribose/xylose/arabinose/galactoside ABC-type transport system permease subunit
MMVSIGLTFVLISGQMDLSLGSIEALASSITAIAAVRMGLPFFVAVVMAILSGIACGFFNGVLVARFKFPPFIATLSMQGIARGIGFILTQGAAILVSTEIFKTLGRGKIWNIVPVLAVIYGIMLVAGTIILKYTRFGVNVYAVGSNEQAANLSGINVKWIKIAVFMISGALAACGGIVLTARFGSGNAAVGESDVMDAVAAVVIGGTSMRGGVGSLRGTFIGVLIIASIRNGLNLLAVGSYYQLVLIGLIIIAAILIDQFSKGEINK